MSDLDLQNLERLNTQGRLGKHAQNKLRLLRCQAGQHEWRKPLFKVHSDGSPVIYCGSCLVKKRDWERSDAAS